MKRVIRFGWGIAVLAMVCCPLAMVVQAAVPHLVRYQGQAVDNQGVPLQGPYTMTFRLYNADTAGSIVWQETQAAPNHQRGQQ